MSERPDRDDVVGPSPLAIEEATRRGLEAASKVRAFGESPRQIGIAVLAVGLAFLALVASPFGGRTRLFVLTLGASKVPPVSGTDALPKRVTASSATRLPAFSPTFEIRDRAEIARPRSRQLERLRSRGRFTPPRVSSVVESLAVASLSEFLRPDVPSDLNYVAGAVRNGRAGGKLPSGKDASSSPFRRRSEARLKATRKMP